MEAILHAANNSARICAKPSASAALGRARRAGGSRLCRAQRNLSARRIRRLFDRGCCWYGRRRGRHPAAIAQNLKRGEELLTRNCASCHAVGRTGDSPHKFAPPFRTLGQRYPIDSLEEALGEGIMSGHPDMPEFSFDAA